MNRVLSVVAAALVQLPSCAFAQVSSDPCSRDEVRVHVLQQFDTYGPQSAKHEYFGFIYRVKGRVESAVVRSSECNASKRCVFRTDEVAGQIPAGAKVLGEWHTHPHQGSRSLSHLDVRGAYNNRHIQCYAAYFSTPSGEIYTWNINHVSVPTAMASAELVGSYSQDANSESAVARASASPR